MALYASIVSDKFHNMLITLLLMSGLALALTDQGVRCKPLFARVRIDYASGNIGNDEATARLGKHSTNDDYNDAISAFIAKLCQQTRQILAWRCERSTDRLSGVVNTYFVHALVF